MNINRATFLLIVGLAALGAVSGCTRPPAPTPPGKTRPQNAEEDPLQVAVDLLRLARTTAGYREGLRLVDIQLRRPEEGAKVQLAPADRDLLEKRFHLEKDEMEEVEANFFKPLDPYHLEQCFLMRDVARALEQPGLGASQQAELLMEWVARQVLLREHGGNLVPPYFVLSQGYGSVRERALVFLALLHQLQIPGCVLAWPEAAGDGVGKLLVGVIVGDEPNSAVYLFDPRLGRSVPGPGGQGIATLAQLRKQPELFAGSKEDGAGRPVLQLACPLAALAPRMSYLEKRLEALDKVMLAVDPAALMRHVGKAAGEEVGVWNSPGGKSPTRMVRFFLPAAEGGVDRTGRLAQFLMEQVELVPWSSVVRRFTAMRLLNQDLVKEAQNVLLHVYTRQLFTQYALEPHDFLLRGHYEKAAKRLDMIGSAFDDLEFFPLDETAFIKELNEWRGRAQMTYLAVIRKQPKAQDMVARLWGEDQYLATLIEGLEKPNPQKQRKTILSLILLNAVKHSLADRAHYLQAQTWQERAERFQVSWQRLRAAGNDARAKARRFQSNAQEAWRNTAGLWGKYVERYAFDWANLPGRLTLVRAHLHDGIYDQVMALWVQLLNDVNRSAAARLNLARALEQEGRKAEAHAILVKLDQDIKLFRTNPDLQKDIGTLVENAKNLPQSKTQLDNLTRDLGPQGGLQALQEITRRRLQEVNMP